MQLNIMYRKALYVFLSVYLVIFSTPSFAQNPPPGGWKWDNAKVTVTREHNAFKASLQAQKTYQVAVVDPKTREILMKTKQQASTVKVAPTATRVGKTLMKRVPQVAMTQAITALLGKSVDWVMDPENNGVKYKEPDFECASGVCLGWQVDSSKEAPIFSTPLAAARSHCASLGEGFVSIFRLDDNWYSFSCDTFSGRVARVRASSSSSDDWKSIPIGSVAQKVLDQANAGEAPATQVISDTALDMFEAGELDGALDAAAEPKQYGENEYPPDAVPNPKPDTGTDPETPTDPENPNPNPNPEPTPWPAFCDWATLACDYYNWAMGAWEPPEGENNEVDIQQPDIGDWQSKANASYVQFDGQCPADVTIPINYMGAATNLSISYQPFCHFASMIKPAVILGAWISAMLIISGGRAKES